MLAAFGGACARSPHTPRPPQQPPLQPKPPPKPPRSTLGPAALPIAGGSGIFKSAAIQVLCEERRLMTTGEITK
jgi:hypothetical protein